MLLKLTLKLKRIATQAHVLTLKTQSYSDPRLSWNTNYADSHVGFEDAKFLRSVFELEHEATQVCVLMINATVEFSVEFNLHVSHLIKSASKLKHHSCVCLKIRV